MAPRETKNNAYAKFWGDKQRTLWYVTVISGVVNKSNPQGRSKKVRVIGRKEKTSFYCTVSILITFN